MRYRTSPLSTRHMQVRQLPLRQELGQLQRRALRRGAQQRLVGGRGESRAAVCELHREKVLARRRRAWKRGATRALSTHVPS